MEKFGKKIAKNMLAPHPSTDTSLYPVEHLAQASRMKAGEFASLCRAKGWAEGKQVTATEFETALEAFNNRPMGGGKI